MARNPRTEEPYLDLRAQAYADKSFMGRTPLSTRTAMFFFLGVVVLAGLAAGGLFLDERISSSLTAWKEAQRTSGAIRELGKAIEDVGVQDGRVRAERSATNIQAHRRSVDRVAISLDTLQRMNPAQPVQDALITMRDVFTDYGSEFSLIMESHVALGSADTTGAQAQRLDAARNVREALQKYDLQAVQAEFDELDALAEADVVAANESISDGYTSLLDLISRSDVSDDVKSEVSDLLNVHASALTTVNELRSRLQTEPRTFEEVLDYIGPAIHTVKDYAAAQYRNVPPAFESELLLARQGIALAVAIGVLLIMIVGIIMLRSVTTPLRRMAVAAENLSRGDRFVTVPLRGNADAIGRLARALDNWLNHLAELDHMRTELDDARMRLAMDVAGRILADDEYTAAADEYTASVADDKNSHDEDATDVVPEKSRESPAWIPPASGLEQAETTATSSRDDALDLTEKDVALPSSLPAESLGTGQPLEETRPVASDTHQLSALGTPSMVMSSIGAASQEINQITAYITAAAVDVERTESLVQFLGDTSRQLSELEMCVTAIRDEANLIVFRSSERSDSGLKDDTLVYLSPDRDSGGPRTGPDTARFDGMRENVSRAERLVLSVRKSLEAVTGLAHEVASTASSEALEATNRLLSQSEYLQNMLDDLVKRIRPVEEKEMRESRPSRESDI